MDVATLKIDRGSRKPARRRRGLPVGRLATLLGAAVALWLFWTPLWELVDRFRLPRVRVLRVVASHPAAVGAVRGTAANGHVVAARRAALSADTPGRIVEMNVTEGSIVKKGDVVARLYADEYAASLRRAKAELVSAGAEVARAHAAQVTAAADHQQRERAVEATRQAVSEAESNLELARDEFARVDDLFARGIAPKSAHDSARTTLETSGAKSKAATANLLTATAASAAAEARIGVAGKDLEVARSQVQIRTAARDLAEATLDKTQVRAPFDGLVVLKDAEIGEVVSPDSGGGTNARGSVCTMVDLDSLEVQAEVPETSLAAVEVGASALVYLDAYPERAYAGRVDRIWPTANRQKATVEVRIKLEKPDRHLRPEMGVRAVFRADGATDPAATNAGAEAPAIVVPQGAVVEVEGSNGVFLLERDTVRFQAVQLGEQRAGKATVLEGLKPGQRIVLDPPLNMNSGDRVTIQEG